MTEKNMADTILDQVIATEDKPQVLIDRLDKLTPEQEKLMIEVRDDWIDFSIGGKDDINEKDLIETLPWLYGLAKLQAPQLIINDSPYASVMKAREMGAKDVHNTDYLGLGHWAGWTAWMDFYAKVGLKGVADLDHFKQWRKFLRSGVWDVLLFEEAALVSRRPNLVKKDDQGRLHNPAGPSVRFRDGFSVYSWHGTTIPSEWIEKTSEVDVSLALTHQNIEQRRALCEILGWSKVLKKLPSKEIQKDSDPQIGTLIEVELPQTGRARFLRVECGTGREFVLAVPNEMQSARQANAWTYGLDEKQFGPEVRT